tara:strand:+ start:1159 stop:1995 length:837 start_codon:yes stop_codon:yes gene_type:complete
MNLKIIINNRSTDFSFTAVIDRVVNTMVYPIAVGAVSSVLSSLVHYSGLTNKAIRFLSFLGASGTTIGYLALQIAIFCIAARLFAAYASQMLDMDLGGSQSIQYRRALKKIAGTVIFAAMIHGGLWLGMGTLSLLMTCITSPLISISRLLLGIICIFLIAIAVKLAVTMLALSVLTLGATTYWLGSRCGLDMESVFSSMSTMLCGFNRKASSISMRGSFRSHSSREFSPNAIAQDQVNIEDEVPRQNINGLFDELYGVYGAFVDGAHDAFMAVPLNVK